MCVCVCVCVCVWDPVLSSDSVRCSFTHSFSSSLQKFQIFNSHKKREHTKNVMNSLITCGSVPVLKNLLDVQLWFMCSEKMHRSFFWDHLKDLYLNGSRPAVNVLHMQHWCGFGGCSDYHTYGKGYVRSQSHRLLTGCTACCRYQRKELTISDKVWLIWQNSSLQPH